jgi:hypothetical protein
MSLSSIDIVLSFNFLFQLLPQRPNTRHLSFVEAQLAHLHSLRVPVHDDMVHAKVETKAEIVLTGAGGLTVGDWVEVLHDFSPGHNSGGGCGVIIAITDNLSLVRYIIDGHVEKFIPLARLTMITMPFRRGKPKLRTRLMRHLEPGLGEKNVAFYIEIYC